MIVRTCTKLVEIDLVASDSRFAVSILLLCSKQQHGCSQKYSIGMVRVSHQHELVSGGRSSIEVLFAKWVRAEKLYATVIILNRLITIETPGLSGCLVVYSLLLRTRVAATLYVDKANVTHYKYHVEARQTHPIRTIHQRAE